MAKKQCSNSEINLGTTTITGETCDGNTITQDGLYVKNIGKVESEICLPTISVIDWDANTTDAEYGQDEDPKSLLDAGYTKDIEALPIGVLAGDRLPVSLFTPQNEYYIGNDTFSEGASLRVSLNKSAVIRTEPSLPTISIVDFDTNNGDSQDENMSDLIGGGYTKDVEALPVGVLAGDYLPVKLGLNDQPYYTGDGNNSSTTALRVAFPESAVIKTEEKLVEKSVNFFNGTQTNNLTIPAGSLNSRVIVRAGEVTINGATYDSCTPFYAEPLSHGGCRVTYPLISVVPSTGAEFTYSYTTI